MNLGQRHNLVVACVRVSGLGRSQFRALWVPKLGTCSGIEGILDADEAVELAKKTNNALYEIYVKALSDHFGFFASVPVQNPEEAAAELERTVKDLGAKGVLTNGFTNIEKNDVSKVQYLDDPKCEPFWKKLSELDVPAKGGTKVHDGDMDQY